MRRYYPIALRVTSPPQSPPGRETLFMSKAAAPLPDFDCATFVAFDARREPQKGFVIRHSAFSATAASSPATRADLGPCAHDLQCSLDSSAELDVRIIAERPL